MNLLSRPSESFHVILGILISVPIEGHCKGLQIKPDSVYEKILSFVISPNHLATDCMGLLLLVLKGLKLNKFMKSQWITIKTQAPTPIYVSKTNKNHQSVKNRRFSDSESSTRDVENPDFVP